ncbi:MAG: class I SAM-dependent methyltransferase [Dermatophilaceae bacterium]
MSDAPTDLHRRLTPPVPAPFPPPGARADPGDLDNLRADLEATAYTPDGVANFLGERAGAALHREEPLPARRRIVAQPGAIATVIALLTLGDAVDVDQVARAFPRTGPDGLDRLGLLAWPADGRGRSRVTSSCDLRPYGDETHAWWVASDLGELATEAPLHPEHVLGVGGASATLASWTPRPPATRALDLGTGCGVQALHLHSHCTHVVATDISPRALEFAAFNAALAGQDWDLRRGDLLEPVAGERFDLIVSNPPFVITPRRRDVPRYTYRDGGERGDALVRRLVRGIGEHLAPGGIAHFLGNWEVQRGQDWRDVWSEWLDGACSGGDRLDALVVQREVQDPCEYAQTWARDGGHRPGTPAYRALLEAWLDDFEVRGVESIGFGVITLSRSPAGVPGVDDGRAPRPGRVDLIDHHGPVVAPMGPWILDAVHARRWLAKAGAPGILERRWVYADDVTTHTYGRPGDPDPSLMTVRSGTGLRRDVRLDQVLAAFASVCDGELTARAALHAIAAVLHRPAADVIAGALAGIEGQIADGLLRPWEE